jgi:hypothetical protein
VLIFRLGYLALLLFAASGALGALSYPHDASADGPGGGVDSFDSPMPPAQLSPQLSYDFKIDPIKGYPRDFYNDVPYQNFAITHEYLGSLPNGMADFKFKPSWGGLDTFGPYTKTPEPDGSLHAHGETFGSPSSSTDWNLTPRLHYQIDWRYLPLSSDYKSPTQGRTWPDDFRINWDGGLTGKLTPYLSTQLPYLDGWTPGFNDAKAKMDAGPTAQGTQWSYYGQRVDPLIGFSRWATPEQTHSNLTWDPPYRQFWSYGEEDNLRSIAPAPTWNKTEVPASGASALPRAHVRMSPR